jgi:aminoglycoside phosphotransferase family enzyme
MLDRALASGRATTQDAERLGAVLADFYRRACVVPIEGSEYAERLVEDVRSSARELTRAEVEPERTAALETALVTFAERGRASIEARARAGRIVEGHGDLRPEHIDLGPPILVIDCLEFKRDFRTLDPLDELAFLALECSLLGACRFARAVVAAYARASEDRVPPGLVPFHESSRALLRAKLAVWHVREPGERGASYWRAKALQYLEHAEERAHAALAGEDVVHTELETRR